MSHFVSFFPRRSGNRAGRAAVAAFVALFGLAAAPAAVQAAEEKIVNVYNWSDYITDETLAAFTKATGIKVNYDVYDSNEIVESKLLVGNSGFDVVFPSATPFFARQVAAGVYRKLDPALLPNRAGVDPKVMTQLKIADPASEYGLPYMMAGTGVGYNVAMVKRVAPDAPVGSLSMLFDPAVLEKTKDCGVTVLDAPEELFPAALAWLGKSPTSTDAADLAAAREVLGKARPYWRYIHSSSYINDLANGAICVAIGYAGDLVQSRDRAKEANANVEVEIFLPREGAAFNIDVMAIPADAPHPNNAHAFINFILTPSVIGPITDAVGYANAVPAADGFTDPAVLADPAIKPAADVILYTPALVSDSYERDRNRAWSLIKAGR
jgi:putrescine transport system substrate-binding protein